MKYCKHVGDNVQMEAGDGETQKINSAKDVYNVLCDRMSISHRDFIDRKVCNNLTGKVVLEIFTGGNFILFQRGRGSGAIRSRKNPARGNTDRY